MKSILCFTLLLCLSNQVRAQSPHGGQLKAIGAYKIEVVNCAGYLEVYLYTLDMQSIRNRGVNGQVDFHYSDGTCATALLYPYSTDSFTAEADDPSYISCEVFISSTGISLRARFDDLICRLPDDEDHLNK